jgi:hypothetical protein
MFSFHLTPVRIAIIKNTITNVGEYVGERSPHTLLVGMYINTTTMEISMEAPQKNKSRTTI